LPEPLEPPELAPKPPPELPDPPLDAALEPPLALPDPPLELEAPASSDAWVDEPPVADVQPNARRPVAKRVAAHDPETHTCFMMTDLRGWAGDP
jgi:hypothetical protein